jgi:Protein of unknown function (DUF3040)
MKSYDGEKSVLHAIESQLRTEDPRLVARFLAFNSVTPQVKSEEGQHLARPRGRRHANPRRYRLVLRKTLIVASMLLAVVGISMVWLLAAVSQ